MSDFWMIACFVLGLLWSVPAFYFGRASGHERGKYDVLYDLRRERMNRIHERQERWRQEAATWQGGTEG